MVHIEWRGFRAWYADRSGRFWTDSFAKNGDGELLLRDILAMPRHGKAVDYETACAEFVVETSNHLMKSTEGMSFQDMARQPKLMEKIQNEHAYNRENFMKWCRDRGWWIELKGDEYRAEKQLRQ